MPIENSTIGKHYTVGPLARMTWRRVWLRLAGEWFAAKWCRKGMWELAHLWWPTIHPFMKCVECEQWVQRQTYKEGLCGKCRDKKIVAQHLPSWIVKDGFLL
jgi:hypothetical protein